MSILKHLFLYISLKFKQLLPGQPCLLCGSTSQNGTCCLACEASLPFLSVAHCPVCALPTLGGTVCGHCLQDPPHFRRTVALFSYDFPLNKLILGLKYGEKFQLATFLGDRLAQQVTVRPDCIIAMPLHSSRLRERGFNQSMQLAQRIGRQLKLPVLPLACRRLRDTPSQSTLPWKAREKNMRKAFACSAAVAGKHVAIVDDVMTTGATLNELAHSLLSAGASEVSAWVVSRTLPHKG